MTVKITYGHATAAGAFTDFTSQTAWTELGAVAGNGAWSIDSGDYADLQNTGGAVEYGIINSTAFELTSAYTTLLYRYKCGDASVDAEIVAIYSDVSGEEVVDNVNSTTWVAGAYDLTYPSGKTLDYVQLQANGAAGHVYYDFCLICKDQFEFPNGAFGMNINFPPRDPIVPIPSKDGDASQPLGTESAVVRIGCDLTQGTWKRATDNIDGEVFLDIHHNRSSELWQWFDTGELQFKVTLHPTLDWPSFGNSTTRRLDLILREYTIADKSGETYAERWGIGL